MDSGARPYQSSGAAPGTPARASRASCTAARRRRASRAARRFRALAGLVRAAHGPPQLTDQLREHQGAAGPVHGAVRAVAAVVRGRVQLVEEPRWLLPAVTEVLSACTALTSSVSRARVHAT